MSGLGSLHKILKDETRQKIIILLNERGSLSYTEINDALGCMSTGKLNYHLKTLGDLISKQEDGRYVLSEKGKLALRLLEEFAEKKSQSQVESEMPKGFMILATLASIIYVSVIFALYFTGSLGFSAMIINVVATVLAIVLLIVSEKARRRKASWSPKRQMLGAKITIMAACAWGGAVAGFFLGGLIQAAILFMLRRAHIIVVITTSLHSFLDLTFWVINPVIGVLIGGAAGYFIYKRSRFSRISYYDPYAT